VECANSKDCRAQAAEAIEKGDAATAMALYEHACEHGDVASCHDLAELHLAGVAPDVEKIRGALQRGCGAGMAHIDACARLARMASRGEGGPRDAKLTARAAASGCSVNGATDRNRSIRAESCFLAGVAARDGKGRDEDAGEAEQRFDEGCQLGHEGACSARDKLRESRDRNKLPGANLNIDSVTVNDVEVKALSCKTQGSGLGGLFGSLTLTAGFGERKAQLDACAPDGKTETTVHWHQRGGRITKVKAEGPNADRNKCVERALQGAPATQDAECKGTVTHGK